MLWKIIHLNNRIESSIFVKRLVRKVQPLFPVFRNTQKYGYKYLIIKDWFLNLGVASIMLCISVKLTTDPDLSVSRLFWKAVANTKFWKVSGMADRCKKLLCSRKLPGLRWQNLRNSLAYLFLRAIVLLKALYRLSLIIRYA